LCCFPHINVLGGRCGTDHRHVERISYPAGEMRCVCPQRVNRVGLPSHRPLPV
jgi:hypothetical protein